ncbi:MAG: hypothetical protein H6713_35250 [Myxococcales bacterium]|nr:hypothetical protein [Myxococcales bacterium]MCB9755226.1 hypothetical protein [Myxococcales bacterium]
MPRPPVALRPALALLCVLAGCSVGEDTGEADYGPTLPTTASASGTAAPMTDGAEVTGAETSDGGTGDPAPTTMSDQTGSETTGELSATDGGTATTEDGGGTDATDGCPAGELGCLCDQGECDGELVCDEGVCAEDSGPQCVDDLLVNDTQVTAAYLGDLQEGESETASGVVLDPDDVDWFMFHGTDTLLLEAQPVFDVTAGDGLVMCAYIDCDNGEQAAPNCPPDTSPTTSGSGDKGCCASNSHGFDLSDYVCSANPLGDDSAKFYISVTPTSECVDFALKVSY